IWPSGTANISQDPLVANEAEGDLRLLTGSPRIDAANNPVEIVPFRGEYCELIESRRSLVKNLIYPVPDPRFPFLGVHFTRMIGGGVEAGPNAVLSFKRDGYDRFNVSLRDCLSIASFAGSWRMMAKHWRMGLGEWHRSLSKRAFVTGLQKLIPQVTASDLKRAGSGVRAQAVEKTGALADDFRIIEHQNFIHVLNAPSPAATASLSIGEYIAKRAETQFAVGA
ncbi:MAG: FAD-dependent oxidoreductase, partial [Planctomycetes bacterium]|nr:FAD-dependent oxidoreductase [Planctomycetota bacterium]